VEYLWQDRPDANKILFTGLDYSGKTSIITALQREFSKIALLKPTKSAQRRIFEFLGRDIAEWDLGGQKSYRIAYLKNPSKYFDNTDVAIYTIDIQDTERFPEAISYFNDVMVQFTKLMINPPICIFFHKQDPALLRSASNEINERITNLKEKIRKAALYDKIYFYNTSIYDFSSIIKAMSEILLALYPKSELIEKTIQEFSKKVNSDGVVALDDNSLVIGSYYKNEEVKNMLNASMPYFLTLNDSLQQNKTSQDPDNQMIVQRFGKFFIFKQITLKEGAPPYYLLLLKNVPHFNNEDFYSLANLMKEILYK